MIARLWQETPPFYVSGKVLTKVFSKIEWKSIKPEGSGRLVEKDFEGGDAANSAANVKTYIT